MSESWSGCKKEQAKRERAWIVLSARKGNSFRSGLSISFSWRSVTVAGWVTGMECAMIGINRKQCKNKEGRIEDK